MRGDLLNLPKAFDRVPHEGLMYKLERLEIYGKFYGLALSFLSDRNQTVALNTRSSNCFHIEAGVPQGSILGPLLFLIYINDLTEELTSVTKLLADNIPLFQLCMTLKQHKLDDYFW